MTNVAQVDRPQATTANPARSQAPARAAQARSAEKSAAPPAPAVPSVRDGRDSAPPPDAQVDKMRQLGQNFRSQPSPKQAQVTEATRPRPESAEAAQVRTDFRQTWDRAQGYYDEGRRLAVAGPGVRMSPDGRRNEVSTLPDGVTQVNTTNPDGSSRSIRYDDTGRVYAQNRGPDGQLRDSIYRMEGCVRTNPYPDNEETGKPSHVFNALPNGSIVGSVQTGMTTFTGQFVSPTGEISPNNSNPPQPAADPTVIPRLREATAPYSGQGVTIGALDAYDSFLGRENSHCAQVHAVATDPAHGVAPGADFKPFVGDLPPGPATIPDLHDDPAALDRALRGMPSQLDGYTERLGAILDDPHRDPKLRVLNVSAGGGRVVYYGQVQNTLDQKGEDGQYLNPRLRQEVYGDGTLTDDQKRERLARYTDQRIDDPQSGYQQSLRQYEALTRRYDDAGISLVVAASNVSDPVWDKAHPGSYINDLGHGPNVITVGATGLGPDGLWSKSAAGEGPGGYNPTVVAPGENVQTKGDVVGSGTSFATPFVSGTIALMLEANPTLSTADIKRILQTTANPLPGVDPRRQGSGAVDPGEAVQRALTTPS